MAPHKFSVDQKVKFHPTAAGQSHQRGTYTIVRLLPSETRDWQYRVKSDHDAHERVVLESQLAALPSAITSTDPWSLGTKMG
jgi:hypothetical protein